MVNGDNKTKQIYKINISYLDLALQKKKKIEFWKLIRSIKNQNWTLIQKSNEKENEKTGASC